MGRAPVSPRLGLGLGHLSLEISSFFKFPLCTDSSLACAPAHGWLFWLLPSFLTTTLKSLSGFSSCSHHRLVVPKAPVRTSSLLIIPLSGDHTHSLSSNPQCAPPSSLYLLDKLLHCVLGPCIKSSKPLRSEMNPLLILHPASLKRSTIHQPARDLGIVLAASMFPPLGVNQSASFVMSAYLISLKSTYFSLFQCNCPALSCHQLLPGL